MFSKTVTNSTLLSSALEMPRSVRRWLRERGASVLVLEKAARHARGGNTYFSGGLFRFPFAGLDDLEDLVGPIAKSDKDRIEIEPYSESDFYSDLMRVTGGLADPDLAGKLVAGAASTVRWMKNKDRAIIPNSGGQPLMWIT